METSFQDYALITDPEDRARVAMLEPLFVIVSSASGSGRQCQVMVECSQKAGMTKSTFKRRYYAWKEHGAIGAADKRKVAKTRATPDILPVFKTYLEKFKGQQYFHAAAHRRMMADFRRGMIFDGIGTWREVWRDERPNASMPAACPANWEPFGWGYANLQARLANDATFLASLEWNVRGMGAALKLVRDVMRSRFDASTGRQLPGGSFYQWDDAFDNIVVMCRGHVGLWRPIGFHCYDVGTGYHLPAFQKPRPYSHTDTQDRIAGDNLTEQMFAMMFFYVHAVIGFHREGVTHILEKGTTAIRETIRLRLESLPGFGRLIKFQTGTPKNMPAHNGLFLGRFGHPQFKSIVEGAHRYRQLETADLPGQIGMSAAQKPESLELFKGHEEKFIAKLAETDLPPDVVRLFSKRFLEWSEYQVIAGARSDAINDTTKHNLEGWGDRYHVEEFCDPDDPHKWYSMNVLNQLSQITQERIEGMMMSDPEHMVRSRRMSRREAWETWKDELIRVPMTEMWYFMDPRWAKELTVTPKRTIKFKDEQFYGKGVEMVYDAKVVDANGIPKLLAPGQQVRVYINCWGSLQDHIWIADMDDKPLGMANRIKTAFWANQEMIKEESKRKIIDMAEVLHDTRSRNWDAAAEKIAIETARKMLISVEKEVKAIPVQTSGGAHASIEELTSDGRACRHATADTDGRSCRHATADTDGRACRPATADTDGIEYETDPADFLNQMNLTH